MMNSLLPRLNVPAAGAAGANTAPARQVVQVDNEQIVVAAPTWTLLPELSISVTTDAGDILHLAGSVTWTHGATNTPFMSFEVDAGVAYPRTMLGLRSNYGPPPVRASNVQVDFWIDGLAAGVHVIDFYGYTNGVVTITVQAPAVIGGVQIQSKIACVRYGS